KDAMSARFEGSGRRFHVLHIELKPRLRDWNVLGPRVLTKTGHRHLRKWPQCKGLNSGKSFGMKVAVILFFESDAESVAVEFAACTCVVNDRPKARDKKHLQTLHGVSSLNVRLKIMFRRNFGCAKQGRGASRRVPSSGSMCVCKSRSNSFPLNTCPLEILG